MSDTYIGPFGRILPLPGRPDTPPPREQSSRMLAGQIQLPLPTRLNFGSDPRPGFPISRPVNSGSARIDGTSSSSRTFITSGSASSQEKLPSVSQLLTPGSQTETPHSQPASDSLYSSRSARSGSGHKPPLHFHSSQTGVLAGSYLRSEADYFHGSYQPRSPSTAQHDSGHSFSAPSGATKYDGSYHVQDDRSLNSYRPTSGPTASSVLAQNGPGHIGWYQAQGSPYDPARASSSNSGASRNDVSGATGPVVRLVGEQVFPGEGLCYVYDDGSHVKKVIDGERVNAQWGITKAGKPRKRLAIACMTCREKKIKCDPAEPKCVQCEKSGRECRFQTAPRQVNKPGTPSYEQQACTPSSVSDRREQHLMSPGSESSFVSGSSNDSRYRSSSLASSTQRPGSPNGGIELLNLKKRRRGSLHDHGRVPTTLQSKGEGMPNISGLNVSKDPYLLDPHFTFQSVRSCLINGNTLFSQMFPPRAFLHWLRTSTSKTQDETMVLYAMVALGSQNPDQARSRSKSSLSFRLAKDAVEKSAGNPSVHLVQARLLISEYLTTIHDVQGGAEYAVLAMGSALNQQLNLEEKEPISEIGEAGSYGLNCYAWKECRRRTFWCAFLLDVSGLSAKKAALRTYWKQRSQALTANRPTIIQKEDITLYLPCDNKLYEKQVKTSNQFFDNGILDEHLVHPGGQRDPPSLLGYLVRVSSICGDVLRDSFRATSQAPTLYPATYECTYTKVHAQLDDLANSLPENLKLNTANTTSSMEHGQLALYTSLHASYYLILMVLNRCVRLDLLPTPKLVRNAQGAMQSARQLLRLIHMSLEVPSFVAPRLSDFTPPPSPTEDHRSLRNESSHVFRCSSEFAAYCLLYCVDVFSSAGCLERDALNSTVSNVETCYDLIESLSRDSYDISPMKQAVQRRLRSLQNLLPEVRGKMRAWAFNQSVLRGFGPQCSEMDLLYSARSPRKALEARGLDIEESAILVL